MEIYGGPSYGKQNIYTHSIFEHILFPQFSEYSQLFSWSESNNWMIGSKLNFSCSCYLYFSIILLASSRESSIEVGVELEPPSPFGPLSFVQGNEHEIRKSHCRLLIKENILFKYLKSCFRTMFIRFSWSLLIFGSF